MGWQIKKLVDVCDLQNGFAFKSKDYIDNSNTLNIRMSNIRPDGAFNPDHNPRFLPDSYIEEYKSFLLKEGDLVIAMTDMAGEPKILGLPTLVGNLNGRSFLMNQRVGKLFDFSSDIYIPFLRYYLSSSIMKEYYKSKGAGGLQINISKKDVLSAEIPLPPLPEQKRIVALLDTVFADLEQTRAKTEQNLKNARELFDSYLQQVFSQKGGGWVDEKMSAVCEGTITDGTHQTPKYFDEGYIFLSSKNVTSGFIDWDNVKYLDEAQHIKMQKRLSPQLNDILLAKNGTTGVAAIVDRDVIFDIYVSLALLRPSEKILPRYLLHFVNSPLAKAQFNKRLKGIGVPNLHLKEIRDVIVSLPESVSEQQDIVTKIDALLVERDKLVTIYQEKLDSIDELKKSILQKAFNGELTAT